MVSDSPGLFAEDALVGQLMLKEGGGSWGIRFRGTWQGGWSRGRRRPGCPKVFCLGCTLSNHLEPKQCRHGVF